jgi:hypothetical protein
MREIGRVNKEEREKDIGKHSERERERKKEERRRKTERVYNGNVGERERN